MTAEKIIQQLGLNPDSSTFTAEMRVITAEPLLVSIEHLVGKNCKTQHIGTRVVILTKAEYEALASAAVVVSVKNADGSDVDNFWGECAKAAMANTEYYQAKLKELDSK